MAELSLVEQTARASRFAAEAAAVAAADAYDLHVATATSLKDLEGKTATDTARNKSRFITLMGAEKWSALVAQSRPR